jgi:ribosomal protein S11
MEIPNHGPQEVLAGSRGVEDLQHTQLKRLLKKWQTMLLSSGSITYEFKSKDYVEEKKKSAVKGLTKLRIVQIVDTTSIPHNGCRAPKKRRT